MYFNRAKGKVLHLVVKTHQNILLITADSTSEKIFKPKVDFFFFLDTQWDLMREINSGKFCVLWSIGPLNQQIFFKGLWLCCERSLAQVRESSVKKKLKRFFPLKII